MNLHRLFLAFLVLLSSAIAQSIATSPGAGLGISPLTSTDTLFSGPALDLSQPMLDQPAISSFCQNARQDFQDLISARIFDVVLRHRITLPVTTTSATSEDDCPRDKHGCYTCVEHWDGDKCADNPGVTHHGPDYNPGRGEMCWGITRCLCHEGQVPSGQSCGSCSYAGQEVVCRPS